MLGNIQRPNKLAPFNTFKLMAMKERITAELLAVSGGIAFFKLTFLPNMNLLAWVFIAMLIDLITGIRKAAVLGEARTSAGFRKSINKFIQYAGAIVGGVILANTLPKDTAIVGYVQDFLLIFIIYIEVTSIFENLYAIDSTSQFARFFISPILRLLTFAIKKTSFNQGDTPK